MWNLGRLLDTACFDQVHADTQMLQANYGATNIRHILVNRLLQQQMIEA